MIPTNKARRRGCGFPSSSRHLKRVPRNKNDANGYYTELGLRPDASRDEISRAYRKLAAKYHPDGASPDEEKFLRLTMIRDTLTDPLAKREYDQTEEGDFYVGFWEAEELRGNPEIAKLLKQKLSVEVDVKEEAKTWFDYYGDSFEQKKAQDWYDVLLEAAYLTKYDAVLRVVIEDLDYPCTVRSAVDRPSFIVLGANQEPNWPVALTAIRLAKRVDLQRENLYTRDGK